MAAVSGRVSWFGGAGDPSDSGHTALGGTTAEPGIAIYNHKTLGGYWRVKAPNGRTAVLKQTDIGPAPWTGRKIDVTYSALGKFGFNEKNFPTDSHFQAEYLGQKPPKEATAKAPTLPGVPTPNQLQVTPDSGSNLDQPGYEEARKATIVGRLLASEKGASQNPLLTTGLLPTKEPDPAEYQKTPSTPLPVPGTPSEGTQGGRLPKAHPQDAPKLAAIIAEADHIDSAHVPYLWGGGHGARVLPGTKVTPLDCSGAVSAALGINPKVSGEFESWGAPGKGGRLTIYANSHHVLMEVDGKFWGTSASNPGGGAGWIKPGVITPEYLKQFRARHPSTEQAVAMHPKGSVVRTGSGPVFVPGR